MRAHDAAEAARILAYREEKRLQEQMMTSWTKLRENAEHAVTVAVDSSHAFGSTRALVSLPRVADDSVQANFTVVTSPVGAKHAVQVSGLVACRIDGARVRTSRGPLTVEVSNLATHPLKTRPASYPKPGGTDADTSYSIDSVAFTAITQRLISAVAV